jgi:hypothetical protein
MGGKDLALHQQGWQNKITCKFPCKIIRGVRNG